ncbi:hypothetical protein BH23BAC1_BH23BAC1_36400 [soil metagenome]
MEKLVSRIKLNEKLWVSIQGNKIVFGESGADDGDHYTISFGNRSGYFDIHLKNKYLTKEEGFTILTWDHQNFHEVMHFLFKKILKSIFEGKEIKECDLLNYNIYKINPINSVDAEIQSLNKKIKGKITTVIDSKSEEFKQMVNSLSAQFNYIKITRDEVINSADFIGFIKDNNSNNIIFKSSFIGNEIILIESISLDPHVILRKILGDEVYGQILLKIEKGIQYLKEKKAERGTQ